MRNILSYKQPLHGKEIKKWIVFHSNNDTEYTKIAKRMVQYMRIEDDAIYRIILRPHGTSAGERRRYKPVVVKCGVEV